MKNLLKHFIYFFIFQTASLLFSIASSLFRWLLKHLSNMQQQPQQHYGGSNWCKDKTSTAYYCHLWCSLLFHLNERIAEMFKLIEWWLLVAFKISANLWLKNGCLVNSEGFVLFALTCCETSWKIFIFLLSQAWGLNLVNNSHKK